MKYRNQEHATEYLRDNEPEPHCDRPEREPDWEWGPDCDPPEPCERCGGKWLIKTSVRRDLLEAVCQESSLPFSLLTVRGDPRLYVNNIVSRLPTLLSRDTGPVPK